jgi:hypothetical protein
MAGALVLACAAAASAQSLADVARREEERRKVVRTSGKVYTNDALRPEQPSPGAAPAVPPPPATQPATPPTPSADAPAAQKPTGPEAAGEDPKTEPYWRKRVTAARDAMSRAQIFAEALQSRINVLSADYVNRDDPAQRDVVATERRKAVAELDRVKQEIQQHQKAIATIQDEARRAGIPAGWVR